MKIHSVIPPKEPDRMDGNAYQMQVVLLESVNFAMICFYQSLRYPSPGHQSSRLPSTESLMNKNLQGCPGFLAVNCSLLFKSHFHLSILSQLRELDSSGLLRVETHLSSWWTF